ncbi:putative ubiquitin-conjugating enzyme E2 23, partial [Mucuna pruriens]
MWDSSGSTVLQLLLSLQALVLNAKPFFNDFWSDIVGRGRVIFKKKADLETTFILNCKTMLCLLQRRVAKL